VLEARTEVVRAGMVLGQAACMVVELVGATVPPVVAVPVEVAMAAHVESLLEKSAPLAVSVAVAEDLVRDDVQVCGCRRRL